MFSTGALFGLIAFALWVYCLFDVITADEADVRHLPKVLWLLAVLLAPLVGSVVWLAVGRARGMSLGGRVMGLRARPAPQSPAGGAPSEPLDREEYLRRRAEALRRWQEEREAQRRRAEEQERLRRPEEDLRREEGPGGPGA